MNWFSMLFNLDWSERSTSRLTKQEFRIYVLYTAHAWNHTSVAHVLMRATNIHTDTHTYRTQTQLCIQATSWTQCQTYIIYTHVQTGLYLHVWFCFRAKFLAAQTFPIPKYIWHLFMFLCIGFRSDRLCW